MMVQGQKIIRDLSQVKTKSLLTTLGIIIGLLGLWSTIIAWYILSRDLPANFLNTLPAQIELRTDYISDTLLQELKQLPDVQAIERRPVVATRVEISPNKWLPMVLFVADDMANSQVNKFGFEAPTAINGLTQTKSIYLERSSVRFADLMRKIELVGGSLHDGPLPNEQVLKSIVEQQIVIRFSKGLSNKFAIAGTVHDPARPPSFQEQALWGYIARKDLVSDANITWQERLIVRTRGTNALSSTADTIRQYLMAKGHQEVSMTYPSSTEHVHQFQINSVLFLLIFVALLSVLLASLLVIDLSNQILTRQVRHIGILKAIGATQNRTILLFLGPIFVIGLAASLIATPLSVELGYRMANFFLGYMNFDLITLKIPATMVFLLLILGICLPLIFALIPVYNWTKKSIIEALGHHGASSQPLISKSLRLPLVNRLPIVMQIGLRNIQRQPMRSAYTALALAVGIFIYLVAINIRSSLLVTAETEIAHLHYDIAVITEKSKTSDELAFLGIFNDVKRVEYWQYKSVLIDNDLQDNSSEATNEPVVLKSMPANSNAMTPVLIDGQWFVEGKADENADNVVVNQRFINRYPHLEVGDRLNWKVNGELKSAKIQGVIKEFLGAAVYRKMTFEQSDEASVNNTPHYNAALITLKTATEQSLAQVIRGVEVHAAMENVVLRSVSSAKKASRIIFNHINIIVIALMSLATVVMVVAAMSVASGIASSIIERTREIGVLRAVGAKPSAIHCILITETLALACVAWLIALLIAQPASRIMADYFGSVLVEYPFDFATDVALSLLGLAGASLLMVVATLIPAFAIQQKTISHAISFE
jgi:putative ABC transport system permease protein